MLAETKDEMREKILDVALKRFTHYGSAKTTMNDIADDLRCSKASLYYYYPDKKGLHKAVLEKIAGQFMAAIEAEVEKMESAEQCLSSINEIRITYLQRFSRLELFKMLNEAHHRNGGMTEMVRRVRNKDNEVLARVIRTGISSGELKPTDPEKMAILYNQATMGLRFTVPDRSPDYDTLDPEELEGIAQQQQLLTDIFIKALKQ
ncbi:TetR/AcrR family transcriptional regulator [Chitinophaga agrisoli]|uniref:TetR/AcrR family transcriptional regulator n=1 Tax=Chitinophaga agrisoli TaxID=2607653 RepID=A0A5B2W2Z8_9BACT|nr:TetR/AcrR family transcriptional regulator [Chitinophaga agrisoli]KAA2244876.1 TetR/AcrR family transcriptional regulator [Chitinophaga agrisoli]